MSAKDSKLKVWDTLKSDLDHNRAATENDMMDKSPVLQLLTVQEDNMRSMEEVFDENDDGVSIMEMIEEPGQDARQGI